MASRLQAPCSGAPGSSAVTAPTPASPMASASGGRSPCCTRPTCEAAGPARSPRRSACCVTAVARGSDSCRRDPALRMLHARRLRRCAIAGRERVPRCARRHRPPQSALARGQGGLMAIRAAGLGRGCATNGVRRLEPGEQATAGLGDVHRDVRWLACAHSLDPSRPWAVGRWCEPGGKHFHHYNLGIALLASVAAVGFVEPNGNGTIQRPRSLRVSERDDRRRAGSAARPRGRLLGDARGARASTPRSGLIAAGGTIVAGMPFWPHAHRALQRTGERSRDVKP